MDYWCRQLEVKNQPITRIIRASGVSEAKFEMTVSAKADGQIISLDAVEGNDVAAGDVLVRGLIQVRLPNRSTLPRPILKLPNAAAK